MARRSPLNPRYQKDTGPAGKTRRSAAAAKPKREAGGRGEAAPAPKKSGSSFRDAVRSVPSTPEMKRWRRIWWALIGLALVALLPSLFIPAVRADRTLSTILLAIYVIFLGGAFYIDLGIIRKLRARATAEAKHRP